jgi:hypothetical protein
MPVGARFSVTFPDLPKGLRSLLYNEHRVPVPGIKRPGHGVDHPPPSSDEVKERVLPLWAFMACSRANLKNPCLCNSSGFDILKFFFPLLIDPSFG